MILDNEADAVLVHWRKRVLGGGGGDLRGRKSEVHGAGDRGGVGWGVALGEAGGSFDSSIG